jgi:hypothetical protein
MNPLIGGATASVMRWIELPQRVELPSDDN